MKKIKKILDKVQSPENRLYVKNILIDNFKSFKDGANIKLAPMVNLIFGQNSAGKSSIFQALRIFRQSYTPGNNMSVMNYESPSEFRGKGGLDIDIGYQGIVNEGDVKKEIGLGVNIGLYKKSNSSISDRGKIKYKFKYVSQFYKGKNLIKNKTIPTNISFSEGENNVSIDLPKYLFFKESNKIFGSLLNAGNETFRFARRLKTKSVEKSAYGSIYDPFYFETKINKKYKKLNSINNIYDSFIKVNRNQFLKILMIITEEFLSKSKLSKKSLKKKTTYEESFFQKRKQNKDIRKKIEWEVYRNDLDIEKRINWFLKNPDFANLLIDDERNLYSRKNYFKSKEFINDMQRFIKFLEKNKKIGKEKFYDYFLNDIIKKNKDLIFFNGEFHRTPKKNESSPLFFRDNESSNSYIINLLGWLLLKKNSWVGSEEVNLVSIFDNSKSISGSKDALDGINKSMQKMVIVPGLRSMPKRYFVKGMQTNYVGAQAENLAELLANPAIQNEVNKWLNRLEIPYDVDIQSSGNYYEIVFKPTKSKINVPQTHIGLGYPLILPLIVQSLISRNKIIVVEEPEVHLHPKIEADLAELIVHSSKKYSNQFLIETHSEEFLLRILKNIREGRIKTDEISINYITNERTKNKSKGSKINKIIVNKFGQYQTPWKDDLFSERRQEFK